MFLQLEDSNGRTVAFFRPTRQTRYQIGDVFGELHFNRTAGAGTVVCVHISPRRSVDHPDVFIPATLTDASPHNGHSDGHRYAIPVLCTVEFVTQLHNAFPCTIIVESLYYDLRICRTHVA